MSDELDGLCRLLDEQGLEWREHEAPATDCIAFFDGNGWHDCWESVDGEVNVTFSMTPEQAIAATLGSSNCTNDCTNSERTAKVSEKDSEKDSDGRGVCGNTEQLLLDLLNDIERNAYDGVSFTEEVDAAYTLAAEMGKTINQLKSKNDGLQQKLSICQESEQEATLGRGTCHDEGDPGDFCCSACGVRMFTDTSDTYTMIASDGRTIIEHPKFCPNCGKRVVDPTTNDVDAEVSE